MFTLEIDGNIVEFKFGIKFVMEMNKLGLMSFDQFTELRIDRPVEDGPGRQCHARNVVDPVV